MFLNTNGNLVNQLDFDYHYRQDFLNNPPPTAQPNIQPRSQPSVVQQGTVAISPDLLPPLPPLQPTAQQQAGPLVQVQPAGALQLQQQPGVLQQPQQPGNAGAMGAALMNPQPPPVMSLAELPQYLMQQGHRLQFRRHGGQQGPQ